MKFWKLYNLKVFILSSLLVLNFQIVQAQELKSFLSSCGYGTLIGAGVGLASLVFEKKPNESYSNIARGASLGLYAGIGVGLYKMNTPSVGGEPLTKNDSKTHFFLIPDFENQSMSAVYTYRFGQ